MSVKKKRNMLSKSFYLTAAIAAAFELASSNDCGNEDNRHV
jgi:hypothetical protein